MLWRLNREIVVRFITMWNVWKIWTHPQNDMVSEKNMALNVHRNANRKSSLNKQKCLANPVFMRVCSILKGLLITN